MKKILIISFLLPLSFFLFTCKSYHDLITLEVMDQGMSSDEEYDLKRMQNRKVPAAVGKIMEVETIRGIQKNLYVSIGNNVKGYKVGLYGFIYNDLQKTQKVGKCKIVEVYSNVSKVLIVELYYKVDNTGVVEVEVDPRFYIKP